MGNYKQRDNEELDRQGGHFLNHLGAMTTEKLHSKSEIASELGWRDMQIDKANELINLLYESGCLDVEREEAVQKFYRSKLFFRDF